MISERKTANGRKVLVIDLLLTCKDGRKERYRRDARVQTRSGAVEEERAILRQFWDEGTIKVLLKPEPPAKVWTFADALAEYKGGGLKLVKEATRVSFTGMYQGPRFARWMTWDVTLITSQAIKEWHAEIIESRRDKTKPCSKSLLRMHRAALMAVLREVGPDEDGHPGKMLAVLPKLPKLPKNLAEREIQAPTTDDVTRVLESVTPAARMALSILAMTGMRPCEVRALTKGQVSLKQGTILIDRARVYDVTSTTKTGKTRTIPIDPRLHLALKDRLQQLQDDESLVCLDDDGEPWKQHGLSNAVRCAARKLGLKDARLYGLRHYCGTSLARVTDIRTIAGFLGHARITTTQRYLSTNLDRMREATLALSKGTEA